MDERATGLVLRTYPLTETSLIVHWLTRELGRLATVAKGARRPKSPFRGKLDLFHECELLVTRSRRSELHTLREVSLIESHSELRRDLTRLNRVVYGAALLEQCTETDTPVPELFELLAGYIVAVAKQDTPLTVFAFELKLLDALGMAPDSASLKLTAGVKRLLHHLTAAEWNGLSALRLSEAQFLELGRFLHGFLSFHVGKIPLSRTKAVNAEVLPCKTDRRP